MIRGLRFNENRPQFQPTTVQPAADSADGNVEGRGDLLVRGIVHVGQDHDIAIPRIEFVEGIAEASREVRAFESRRDR